MSDAGKVLPIHVAKLAERNGWRPEQFGTSVNGAAAFKKTGP